MTLRCREPPQRATATDICTATNQPFRQLIPRNFGGAVGIAFNNGAQYRAFE